MCSMVNPGAAFGNHHAREADGMRDSDQPGGDRPGGDRPGGEDGLLSDDGPVPMQLAASWDQAEAKLYPAVTTRPDLYQRVLTVVRLTVDRLRALGVRWVLADATRPRAATLEPHATLRFSTGDVDVYEL